MDIRINEVDIQTTCRIVPHLRLMEEMNVSSFLRIIKLSSPKSSNLIILGSLMTYISVILNGVDQHMVGAQNMDSVCRVSFAFLIDARPRLSCERNDAEMPRTIFCISMKMEPQMGVGLCVRHYKPNNAEQAQYERAE